MSPILRILLAVGLLAGGGTAYAVLFAKPAENVIRGDDVAKAMSWQSSEQCKQCHQDVWDEWKGSHHQISYLNPEVRALSDDFRNKECQACHLSQPVSITGFAERTLPRQTRPTEGIGCITCHLGKDGEIMARNSRPDVACAPVQNEMFFSVELCASCHNQHETTDQWRASHYAEEGIGCSDCHMDKVERVLADGSKKPGREHRFPGCHEPGILKKAGTFEVELDGDELVLALTNSGAGHSYPTEERHRAVDMMYRFVTADGAPDEWQLGFRFRRPYRDEPGEDTQLPAGERKEVRVPVPAGTVKIEARLWYRLKPFIGDDDPASTLLEEREVIVP